MERVKIVIQATDPITYVGLSSFLQSRPEVVVVEQRDQADVQVLSTERVGPEALAKLRASASDGGSIGSAFKSRNAGAIVNHSS